MSKKGGFSKFLAGAAVGVGLGMLFAPKSGKETREDLMVKFDELMEKVKNIDVEETKDLIVKKINKIKKEIKDLDKEKLENMAKEEAKKIKKDLDELVAMTKEKCTPVVEKAATELRNRVAELLKTTAQKIEK